MFAVVGSLVVVVALGSMLLRGRSLEVFYARWLLHNGPASLALLWFGRAMTRRWPAHRLARLFLAIGAIMALHIGAICLADARLVAAGLGRQPDLRFVPAALPLDASVPFWFSAWLWLLPATASFTLLLLLFPDGHLPSPRWRSVVPVTAAGFALVVTAYMADAWPTSTRAVTMNDPPSPGTWMASVGLAGAVLLAVAAVASVASLVVRWRGAGPATRPQLRPVVVAGIAMATTMTVLWPWQELWIPASLVAVMGFLGTYTVAVLRYRLHDLDVVINRTVAGSVLAALVTLIYLAVVVGVGSLVGRQAAHPLLPLVATGLVAVLFEPARRRVRRIVDRMLYGRDADAYEVLSELSRQLRNAGSARAVTGHVAQLLVRGTGAAGAEVILLAGADPRVIAGAGETGAADAVHRVPVVHDGDQLGEVVLYARASADLAPDAPLLVEQVAGTLGAVLRNTRLTAELEEQVAELRRSRQRLVTAQDQARREFERDLHDGTQAQLVALRLQVGLLTAQAAALSDGAEVGRLRDGLAHLGDEVDGIIRSLRDLARGLRPPVLESDGLVSALRAGVRGLPVDVEVVAGATDRFPPAVEASVYFVCLEAVTNAVTHGHATKVRVGFVHRDGWLRFSVEDDGGGFDPGEVERGRGLANLDDRIESLDGRVEIVSTAGQGTRIEGAVPAQPSVSER
ncbi:MAG: ATP-binding protein [Nitriliruptoraceae bacterium]